MQMIQTIITNILTALYQPFWYAVLSSVLMNFLYLYAYHPVNAGKGLKSALKAWISAFQSSAFFRKLFFLFFITIMILFRTLLNRNMWENPLSDVMGGWWIWKIKNNEKQLTTECFENLLLMIPFTFCLFYAFEEKRRGKASLWRMAWMGFKTAFLFSLAIETLQLILRLGTWQFADLFYNTLGGAAGGLIYYMVHKLASGAGRRTAEDAHQEAPHSDLE